jgi:hypothetical protein
MSTVTIDLVLALALAAPPAGADAAAAVAAAAEDLSAERAEAEAARKQAPGVATWGREAEVCERLADYACARAAWTEQRALTAAGSPERAAADEKLARLGDLSRGTVADEPASTRRAENDRARQKPLVTVAPAPTVDKKPAPVKHERIVKKWYFWVTVIAIAASGAAITAIAVDAAKDEQKGAQPVTSAGSVRLEGFGLRF